MAPSWVAIVDSAGGDAFEGVEDLVVLAAARGEHGDDVFDAGALDVGDVGLHRAARGAGAGGAPDALLEAARQPRQVEVDEHGGGLEVVALVADPRQAQHRELAGAEAPLELLEVGRLGRAVADVGVDAVALAQGVGELAQAAHAVGEHDHLLLAAHAGDRLRGDPAQQRQPVAAAAHRRRGRAPGGESALASAALECSSVSGSTEASR